MFSLRQKTRTSAKLPLHKKSIEGHSCPTAEECSVVAYYVQRRILEYAAGAAHSFRSFLTFQDFCGIMVRYIII